MKKTEHKVNAKSWFHSIVFKLMCVFLLTLLPMIGLFGYLYYNLQQETIKNLSETTFTRDAQIFENFYSKIQEVEFRVWDMYHQTDLTLLSDLWIYYDEIERIEKIGEIQQQLQWYKFMEWFVYDLRVYLPQQKICISYNYWREMTKDDDCIVEQYFDQPETLVKEAGNANVHFYVGDLTDGMKRDQISALCRMTISEYKFHELANLLCADGMAETIILAEGNVLSKTIQDEELLQQMLSYYEENERESLGREFEIQVGGEKFFCSYVGAADRQIDVLTCRSYGDVFAKTKEHFGLIYAMSAVSIVIFGVFLFYVRRYIIRPVVVLNEAFQKINNGNEEVQVNEVWKDEFNDLYTGFNEMSQRLSINIQKNYLMKIDLQREQMKQLQAQINPHFLYNTLFLIKIRIQSGNLEGARKMTELLGEYFRYMNRNRREVIALSEELGCIRTYMDIQMERYSDRFQFIIGIFPDKILQMPLPRLLLQPLVENAIKYGAEQIEENGVIHLSCEQEGDTVRIIIEQTGMNICLEEVEKMNACIQDPPVDAEITSTININMRIKLFYGDDYGLYYRLTEDGTFRTIVELDGGKTYEQMEDSGGR